MYHNRLAVIRQTPQTGVAHQRLCNHLIEFGAVHKIAIETVHKVCSRDRRVHKALSATMTLGDSVYAEFVNRVGKAAGNLRPGRMACEDRAKPRRTTARVQWS